MEPSFASVPRAFPLSPFAWPGPSRRTPPAATRARGTRSLLETNVLLLEQSSPRFKEAGAPAEPSRVASFSVVFGSAGASASLKEIRSPPPPGTTAYPCAAENQRQQKRRQRLGSPRREPSVLLDMPSGARSWSRDSGKFAKDVIRPDLPCQHNIGPQHSTSLFQGQGLRGTRPNECTPACVAHPSNKGDVVNH
jgi:hypothetical protein